MTIPFNDKIFIYGPKANTCVNSHNQTLGKKQQQINHILYCFRLKIPRHCSAINLREMKSSSSILNNYKRLTMSNVKNIILVLGTTITLTGCLSGELSDDQKNAQTDNQTVIETPAISNLSEIASRIGDGFPIGAAVSESNITDTNISAIVIQHFNQVTAENIMKPEGLQPNEGDFTFDKADALVDYADDNGMAVHAHTLVWHSQSPAWMKDCTDVADCTDVMNTHITEVVQHFAGENIASWDVVNEAFNDNDGSYRGSNETFGGIS